MKLLLGAHANPTICDRFGRRPRGENKISCSCSSSFCNKCLLVHFCYLEVCPSKSLIRAALLKAEAKFEEKYKCAEQSDDSLEEEHSETIDSLSDEENNEDDIQMLFNPIPQQQPT